MKVVGIVENPDQLIKVTSLSPTNQNEERVGLVTVSNAEGETDPDYHYKPSYLLSNTERFRDKYLKSTQFLSIILANLSKVHRLDFQVLEDVSVTWQQ